MKKLFLIDAYALIYRFYYAFLGRPMRNAVGMNTSPVFGFVKFLKEIIRREDPKYLGVAFDSKGDTFRHEMFPDYKANRMQAPEDIHDAVPYIKDILKAMRIPILEMRGWEADDIIGTLSAQAAADGFEVFMVSPDKDYGQLVTDRSFIYKQKKSGEGVDIIGPGQIREQYGIDDPKLIIDILALWGDASDNIPGVTGIGEKTAIKLVCEFGTVENLLENVDQLKGKLKENIIAGKDDLILSKKLAAIDLNVPVEFDPAALEMEQPDLNGLRDIYRELGFSSFIKDLSAPAPLYTPAPSAVPEESDAPRQAPQTQLARIAAEKSRRRAEAAMKGQGSLFDGAVEKAATVPDVPDAEVTDGLSEDGFQCISTNEHTYCYIKEKDELARLVSELETEKEFSFEMITTGPDTFNDKIVGIGISYRQGNSTYVVFTQQNSERFAAILKPVFENPGISKISQNMKTCLMVLDNVGIHVEGPMYDPVVLHYLLDPESRHSMGYIARMFLGYSPIESESLIGKGAKQITYDMVTVDKVSEYACEMADINLRLKQILWEKVQQEGLADLYRDIEEPMIRVLADIERTGVKIDSGILADYGKVLTSQLIELEEKIRSEAGEPNLNVNSSRQLGDVLFTKLRIDPKPKMTKTKQFRTDEEYLQSLSDRSPIIGLILEYRGMKKLMTTYVDALPKLVNSRTGRLHTSFNQTITATGRLSSSNPNLQNIPIRDEQGREIRKAFVPSDSEHLLFSADYSQVELRLMAHLSGDEWLLEAFRNKEDIHTATAARIFNIPQSEVTADHRRKAKTANFGIIYGISAFGLSQRLNIPRGEAKEIIDGYFASYPGVKDYMDNVIGHAKEQGFVSTIFGRKRFLNDIRSGNSVARGLAERNAINAPLQGSAADIIKIAMIRIHRQFIENGLKSRLILQVHDELVVDMYKPEQERVTRIVVDAMESAATLSIPLTVDYGIGANWIEAH